MHTKKLGNKKFDKIMTFDMTDENNFFLFHFIRKSALNFNYDKLIMLLAL